MDKQSFILKIKDSLEIEASIDSETNLKELEEWDSMTAMMLVAFVSENFEVDLSPRDIAEITTVNSLIERIGFEKFESKL